MERQIHQNMSIEVKKLLCFALPRITTTEVRLIADKERFFDVLHELNELKRQLEEEILDEEGKEG